MFPFMPTAVIDRDSFLAAQEATFTSPEEGVPPDIPEDEWALPWAA